MVGVMVAKGPAGLRVAVTGAGQEGVHRVAELEAALGRSFAPEAIAGIAVGADSMMTDIHASAAYRAHLVGVLARRAVTQAMGGAWPSQSDQRRSLGRVACEGKPA
jgi:aerobic carbon-monoxide dehydrogenase medium subunit